MARRIRPKTLFLAFVAAFSLALTGAAVAETDAGEAGGETLLREASLPDGWPALTPVGEIQVKAYPDTRAAYVREDSGTDSDMGKDGEPAKPQAARSGNRMFWTLFQHIKTHDIAMTAPVDMGYREVAEGQRPQQTSMAFLYRHTEQGEAGPDGAVSVEDVPGRVYVSIGIRGGYTDQRFTEHLAALDAWLAKHDAWEADGPPRYLGYNSPMVPDNMKYSEVQRPVRLVAGGE